MGNVELSDEESTPRPLSSLTEEEEQNSADEDPLEYPPGICRYVRADELVYSRIESPFAAIIDDNNDRQEYYSLEEDGTVIVTDLNEEGRREAQLSLGEVDEVYGW